MRAQDSAPQSTFEGSYDATQDILSNPTFAEHFPKLPQKVEPEVEGSDQLYLSPQAAAAATELIQNFLASPTQSTSAQEFLLISQKHNLDPKEAH